MQKAIFLRSTLLFLLLISFSGISGAQQAAPTASATPAATQQPGQPPVKVNYLNVCAPGTEEQAEIKSALAKVASKPAFAKDFEVSRGRATVEDSRESRFVRLRKDLSVESPLLTAQYSISSDDTNIIETLVVRMRDPKQFHELSLEDRVTSGAAAPASILSAETPVIRIRLERFSKNSIVLTRCQDQNQSAYEPLFKQATDVMSEYRKAMGLRSTLGNDIHWISAADSAKSSPRGTSAKKK